MLRSAFSLRLVVIVALTLRLLLVLVLYQTQMSPDHDHFEFGWEVGRIARSLAEGKGFSSPLFGDTGPTAWQPPLYCLLLAGVFKIFGIYTAASAIVILVFNAAVSAFTCIPLYRIAAETLNKRTARIAAWIWVFFPYSLYFSTGRIWPNSLNVYLLTLMVWAALHLQRRGDATAWAGMGALAAANALVNPVALATLPFLVLWAGSKLKREGKPLLLPLAAMSLVLMACCAPWTIRNYHVFHKFIPLRNTFWMEMHIGNNGDLSELLPGWSLPSEGAAELAQYQQLGDQGYEEFKKAEAIGFLKTHPGFFAYASFRRFVYTWTGFWTTSSYFNQKEPTHYPNMALLSTLTLLMLVGLRRLWRQDRRNAWLYLIVLFAYPAIYYISHTLVDYRHPMDALILPLAVHAFAAKSPVTSAIM